MRIRLSECRETVWIFREHQGPVSPTVPVQTGGTYTFVLCLISTNEQMQPTNQESPAQHEDDEGQCQYSSSAQVHQPKLRSSPLVSFFFLYIWLACITGHYSIRSMLDYCLITAALDQPAAASLTLLLFKGQQDGCSQTGGLRRGFTFNDIFIYEVVYLLPCFSY